MENKLIDGDYVPDGNGGIVRLTGNEALLQRALFCLQCRRGAFSPMPELGSSLYLLHRQKPSQRRSFAMEAAEQALSPLGLRVCDTTVTETADGTLAVTLFLEDGTLEVAV